MGIAMSGLTADGRSLVKYEILITFGDKWMIKLIIPVRYMRTEALNNKYVYNTPIQGSRLVADLADMHQQCTQSYVRRPYGVGLLVASYDQTGPEKHF